MSEVWYREDRVLAALDEALRYAVKNGGAQAKGFAWDVNFAFKKGLGTDPGAERLTRADGEA